MKIFRTLLLLLLSQTVLAQMKVTPLDKKAIPASIKYSGHIVNAARFTDSEGEHIIISTETGNFDVKLKGVDEELTKAELFAYCYLIKEGKLTLTWQMHDFTIECPVDTKATYVPGSFAITDLNKDNKAEVWLMYSVACRGDVSPAGLKIIMHEGPKKYAVRGESRVNVPPLGHYGGKYTMDDAFKKGPVAFQQYAIQLWKKNMNENW